MAVDVKKKIAKDTTLQAVAEHLEAVALEKDPNFVVDQNLVLTPAESENKVAKDVTAQRIANAIEVIKDQEQDVLKKSKMVKTKDELANVAQNSGKAVDAFVIKQIVEDGANKFSIISVHTTEQDFKGLTVTATQTHDTNGKPLEDPVSATIDADGNAELKVHNIGTFEVSVTFNGGKFGTIVAIPYFSIYSVTLSKEFAVIKVVSNNPETKGRAATITSGTYSLTGVFDSATNELVVRVFKSGNYNVTVVGGDGVTRTSSVSGVVISVAGDTFNGSAIEVDYATITISTGETELYSQGFTATHATASPVTGTLGIDGSGSFKVYDTGEWTITASGASDTASAKVNVTAVNETFEVRLSYAWIVGMKVDESVQTPNARITLLEDAAGWDFATIDSNTHGYDLGGFANWKWLEGVYPAMVHSDGREDYKLDPTNYAKKIDGTTNSDVANTDYDGGAFVHIPKLYVYQKVEGNNRFVYFGKTKQVIIDRLGLDSTEAENVEANGFIDELTGSAVENSHVWIPMFYGTNVGGKLRSIASGVPLNSDGGTSNEYSYITAVNATRAAFFAGSIVETLVDIFYMMFGTTHSQSICRGHDASDPPGLSALIANAVIGAGQDGLFYGTQDNTLNKIFHSIVLGGNQTWQRDPYLIQSSGKIFVSPHYKYSLTAVGYKDTSITKSSNLSWTYIKKKLNIIKGWGAFSSDDGATNGTGYADGSYYTATGVRVAVRFGVCNYGGIDGLSAFHLAGEVSASSWDLGASVLLFPPAV